MVMNNNLSQVGLLTRILDTSSMRHRVIAQNIANVNTPGYSRLELTFEDQLTAELQGASGRPVPRIVASTTNEPRADGNNVSLEQEISDLNKNTLLYNTAAQLLTSRLATLRSSIAGR
jgi:flagellar basal-body rod protein FlgB